METFAGITVLAISVFLIKAFLVLIAFRTFLFVISYIRTGDAGDPDNCLIFNSVVLLGSNADDIVENTVSFFAGIILEKNPGACLADIIAVCGLAGIFLAWKIILLSAIVLGSAIFIVDQARRRQERLKEFKKQLSGTGPR